MNLFKKIFSNGNLVIVLFAIITILSWIFIVSVDANTKLAKVESNSSNKVICKTIDKPITFDKIKYKKVYSLKQCKAKVNNIKSKISYLKSTIKTNSYSSDAIKSLDIELERLKKIALKYKKDIKYLSKRQKDYYFATKTWSFLRSKGYSKVVSSAILGNMMVETGGKTLNLDPANYSSCGSYYGLCQWSLKNRPRVEGMAFKKQLKYLDSDLSDQFNIYGFCYQSGFDYKDFLTMKDPADAALAFAKIYERCASFSYSDRQNAARTAYKYFKMV
jgi:hypothetical protein